MIQRLPSREEFERDYIAKGYDRMPLKDFLEVLRKQNVETESLIQGEQ